MEKKKKIIKIVLIVSIVLFLIILIIANKVAEKKEIEDEKENYYANKVYNSIEDFKTVEEVLIFKGVEYIKDEKASDDEYNVDIYVKLKYPLYTEEEDKEQYYTNMMVLLANVLNYQNFRVIDNEKQIILGTTCEGEPFFYKNDFYTFLKNIPKKSKLRRINIVTNGLLVDDDFAEITKNSKLRYGINFSINGWDRESYKYLMGVDGFDKVFKNIEKLKESSNVELWLSFVITEYTIQNRNSFFEAIKKLKEKYFCRLQKELSMPQEKYNEFKFEFDTRMGY